MSLGGSDSGESNSGGSLNLDGITQAPSCIVSTTHGLGTTVGKGSMCLCQICAELLLIFYFLPTIGTFALQQVFSSTFSVGVK